MKTGLHPLTKFFFPFGKISPPPIFVLKLSKKQNNKYESTMKYTKMPGEKVIYFYLLQY